MNSRLFKIYSLILSLVLLINMLPLNVWAEQMDTVAKVETQSKVEPAQAEVLGEVIENRTQFTKDYRLNNGFYVSAVYAEPVHFEEDGQWEEIDNTLKAHSDGTYGNTAGVWDVRFPQTLTGDRNVTITKDGYTLSFGMAGALRKQGNLEIAGMEATAEPASRESAEPDAAIVPAPLETASVNLGDKTETFAVSAAKLTAAQILNTDDPAAREAAQYEELVLTKTSSGLLYSNVYGTTDIQYDLQSNKVKESVILESYDADLRGFRYNLDVGELVPVLNDDGSIDFYDAEEESVVMVMPAPFLIDDAMVTNHDVRVILNGTGSNYTLIYMLPQTWLAEDGRSWPVILDPEVKAESTTMNIQDQTIMELKSSDYQWGMLQVGKGTSSGNSRIYLGFDNIPNLTSADVIVNATVGLYKPEVGYSTTPVTVHKVPRAWNPATITWSSEETNFVTTAEDYALVIGKGWYYWDVTDIVRGWYTGANTGMMFKATDEIEASASNDSFKQFYSCNFGSYKPMLEITYRNNSGLESYWDYTSSSAGRAGTGHINSYTGNLTWVRSDIGFSGNRMPVNINHIYNLNDSAVNDFGLGFGWRTNYHQRVYETNLTGEICYRWEDDDGTDHYFFHHSANTYKDEDGLELTLTVNDGSDPARKYTISNKLGETRQFDTLGRLTYLENYQTTKSAVSITYVGDVSPSIAQISDGVNRIYVFTYDLNTGLLSRIDYKGNDSGSYSHVQFAYNGTGDLTKVTDRDGKESEFAYTGSHILHTAEDIDGYKLTYTYNQPTESRHPRRVQSVSASQNGSGAGSLTLTYAHNQTTFTDHNGKSEIMQFNDYGNTISIQDGLGRAQYAQYALNNSSEAASATSTQKSNQMRLSSRLQNTVQNYFLDSSFEDESAWAVVSGSGSRVNSDAQAYMGTRSLAITNDLVVRGGSLSVGAGQTYSFSAYVKTVGTYANVRINDSTRDYYGETLYPNYDWTRLEVSYTNTTGSAVTVTARLVTEGTGTTYMDCVQGEKMESASRYTLVQNGDFRHTQDENKWTGTEEYVIAASPAPQLSQNLLKLTGSPTAARNVTQTISVSGQTGDTYVLAGWGKGDSAVLETRNSQSTKRQFGIIGTFTYTDGTKRSVTAAFNPDNNSTNAWQYSAQIMVAEKPYSGIEIKVSYDYNINTAYFDGIQLFKEEFGSHYTYDTDGNVITVADAEGEKTQLTYYPNTHDLREEVLPTGLTNSYEYDTHHNVKKITTKNTATGAVQQVQEFTYDTCGNLLQQETTANGLTLLTKSTYSDDKNHLTSTTDAAGNTTRCWYNTQTSVLEWTQYPNDSIDKAETAIREGTATYYGYDNMYRTKSISAVASENRDDISGKPTLTANYTYNDYDLLTRIQTASTTYNFGYGNFGLRRSVQVGSKTLASYTYTNDQNHYLQKVTYGNGDFESYTYDSYGRMTGQANEEEETVSYKYDNNGDLASVYDSATGLTTRYSYDFTGRTGATEIHGANGLELWVTEQYDAHNRPTFQTRQFASTRYTDAYAYNSDGTLQSLSLGDLRTITYEYDGLKRITAMNTGTDGNTGPNGRTFTYVPVDDPNFAGNTTGQIKKIQYDELMAKRNYPSFDFDYEYDDNGNISKYTSPVETIEYTYDTQNQLLEAKNTGNGMVFSYTYDDAGNILTAKKGSTTYTYEYTNADWGDLLTKYNGTTISYDAIGNPLSYYNGWSFTWQQGREMATATKSGQSLSFTYDADGVRRTKTVNGVTHTYYYVGGKLARETYGSNVLDFFYDQNGHPFMMVYNGAVYYYVTNAQGDVIRVTNVNGETAARYQYDPYGNIIDSAGSHVDINPLRYRGYYYDKESGLYYLQSRYYDPNTGRFINADGFTTTGQGLIGSNMFAYCLNNPVVMADPSGACGYIYSIYFWSDCGKKTCVDSKSYVPGVLDSKKMENGKSVDIYDNESSVSASVYDDSNIIVVIDKRGNIENPCMQVRNSYLITKSDEQTEILEYLLDYNSSNPSAEAWVRTVDSMLIEWDAHNDFALFDDSAKHTDFDNAEEGKSYWYYVGKAADRGYQKYIQPIFQ